MTSTAEAVLIAHQRFDSGGCLCGWSELGKSHPGHQVQMLAEAGVLVPEAVTPVDYPDHLPVQHRDGKPPWCNSCGRDQAGQLIGRPRGLDQPCGPGSAAPSEESA